uniref:OTU domain-containing protein n=1 Tax=Phytophthora fragariae TaxID=53985 RepID=A0A6A3DN83_9STRA|nr:hypothetical protein PF009_g29869 [Phytophthora fragariae]
MLEGIWNPLHKKHLMGTLLTDWEATGKPDWSPEETSMRQEALAAANTACDESVRAWTQRENVIMTTYLQGRLDLPHPPNFIKEILIGEHRAMLEDMHEAYFNAVLTAVVPATVKMTRNAAHAMIFRELFIANTDKNTGHAMMRALQRDVKRLRFDGVQTLSVTFYSRTAADRWQEKALRLQKAVIVLRNTQRHGNEDGTGQYTPAQLEIQYAIRVFGGETMGLAVLARMFARVSDAKVLDVEYAREQRTEIYDNRYHTIRFAQRECPVALKGVSRIRMGDQDIIIHLFQQNLRKPCSRCLSQRHGTVKCSVAFSKLAGMQAKATRILDGVVEQAHVAPRREYQVESVEQLVEMLKRTMPTQSQGVQLLPAYNDQPQNGAAGQDAHVVGATSTTRVNQHDAHDAREATVESDEEELKLKEPKKSKAAKAKERKTKRDAGTGKAGLTLSGAGSSGQRDSKQAALRTNSSQVTKSTTNKGRLSTPRPTNVPNKRFEKFQRTEALGRYGVLADSDSEDGESNGMDVDEGRTRRDASVDGEDDNDAPYAFPDSPEYAENKHSVIEPSPAFTRPGAPRYESVATEETKEEVNSPTPMEDVTLDVQHQIVTTRTVTSAKASGPTSKATRRQRQLNAGIGLPQGAIKVMQTSMANFMHQVAAAVVTSTEAGGPRTTDSHQEVHGTGDVIIPATPDSQQEFTMGETRVGTAEGYRDLPIQLGQWLHSFQGHEVKVAANGQCAFLAMLASNINHKGPEMKTTTTVAKDATTTKWYVYTLMMANLRKDVELDLVNPIEECAKLYPGQPRHTSVNGATAALYVHYDTARQRSVGRNVPASFWAGPHELRALAQYLREPIIVFDVSENTDAHMQRYCYKHYRLADGTDHEVALEVPSPTETRLNISGIAGRYMLSPPSWC